MASSIPLGVILFQNRGQNKNYRKQTDKIDPRTPFIRSREEQQLYPNAGDLICIKHAHLEIAFRRARRELNFSLELENFANSLARARDSRGCRVRAAWDELTKFGRKYVSNDVLGNFGPERGW